jgi:ADP-heptose:LPS heptosyltransferase
MRCDYFSAKNQRIINVCNAFAKCIYHTPKSNEPINKKDIKKIVIFLNSLLGDAMMWLPAFRIIRLNYPHTKIVVVGNKIPIEIYKREGLIDDGIIVEWTKVLSSVLEMKRSHNNIKKICKNLGKFDFAIEIRGDFRLIYYMHYVDAKRKLSSAMSGGECFLTDRCFFSIDDTYIKRGLILCDFLMCTYDKEKEIPYLQSYRNNVHSVDFISNNELQEKYIIGINPGASRKKKKWNRYDELVSLITIPNAVIMVCYIDEDIDIVNRIKEQAKCNNIKCYLVRKQFHEYVELLSACDVLISNDSGAGHIAAALGIDTVTIFGPTDWRTAQPVGKCISKSVYLRDGFSNVDINGVEPAKVYDELFSIYKNSDKTKGETVINAV